MKNLKGLATAMLLFAGITASFAQAKTETIKVSGNCGMCAKTISKAATKAGASKASWNEETKVLTVTYDESKTTNDAIQKKVADAGYDTEKYIGDEKAYNSLHGCCQYNGKRSAAK
jgi:copper chaperone CopZ